jgi:VWFA-related protein
MRKTLAFLLALAAALPLAAQQAQPQPPTPKAPAPSQQKPAELVAPYIEKIDVRVISVDVIVTDKKGNRVTGLTKDDFLIYENGIPKAISNFYEVVGEKKPVVPATSTAPAPKPTAIADIPDNQRRRLILYIDNLSLAPFNRNRVFKDMKKFIETAMRPGDEAMIATFNKSIKVRLPFTRDAIQVQQTLDSIMGESGLGLSARSESHDTLKRIQDAQGSDEAIGIARQYAESVQHDLRENVEAINGLLSTVAGLEGKKVLILTTEGFQMQPGREMFYAIEETGREKGWASSGSLLEGMSFDSNAMIQSVAKSANANNVTLYTIHAGGLGAGQDNNLAEFDKATSYSVTSTAISNSTESLQMMAEMTGGLYSINTNNFGAMFKKISDDLESYYSLGYRAGTERVDRQRTIDVRTKNPNYLARSRQSFVEKSTYADMGDKVVANLLYRTKANELKIVTKINSPVPADDLFKIPVEVHIPMENLTLLPQGEVYAGSFTLFVAVGNKDGDMSEVQHQQATIRVPQADYAKIKGKYYTYTLDLLVEPGLNNISIGVIDDVSNTQGFDRQQVIAKDLR